MDNGVEVSGENTGNISGGHGNKVKQIVNERDNTKIYITAFLLITFILFIVIVSATNSWNQIPIIGNFVNQLIRSLWS